MYVTWCRLETLCGVPGVTELIARIACEHELFHYGFEIKSFHDRVVFCTYAFQKLTVLLNFYPLSIFYFPSAKFLRILNSGLGK